MQHLRKFTTLGASGAVALCLLIAPSVATAAPATVVTATTGATAAPTTTAPTTTLPTASSAIKPATATRSWTVLVGTFPAKATARTQLTQLRKLGFEHFHIVHVGKDYLVRERHLRHATATKLVAKLKAAGITATELQ